MNFTVITSLMILSCKDLGQLFQPFFQYPLGNSGSQILVLLHPEDL